MNMMSLFLLFAATATMAAVAEAPLVEGNPGSTVRIIIYEDLQCSDCAQFRLMLDQKLLPRFGSTAAFEHRDFPLPKHKWARDAAVASRYFGTLGPEMAVKWRQYAMGHQQEVTPENFREKLGAWAKQNGAAPDKAVAALGDTALTAAVDRDYQDGVARGIAHTPTVLVNGEPFIETFTYEEISTSIEKALAGR
jgi:protein-disulfide isomerase